ncbi:MAG: TIGR00730 family Rossman fold protein [Rhodospirillales bacterium]|nr:TIGR00730 family Rossman fold protein [Rhodospirillales bacterium]MCB9965892.1 TIGR00730 family Rossman fold protein [Rhodospirillales bacterium]MCB9973655.1 TIGR00730 family Rossman fold protein [Rhodospirillales bacterium]MCB9980649.1 TIGR00730 family Rossman fold protein [Rhodospirillales bacterium]
MTHIKSVTVYLGSSGHARPVFYEQAYALGKKIAQSQLSLVFGGMNAGAMRSVSNAVLEHGGEVIGVIPTKIRDSERVSRNISKLIDVETMWERKKLMFDLGDMLVMMPGGYGTLDEGLEAVYWKSLGLHNKEIIFVDVEGYWTPLFDYIHHSVKSGAMPEQTEALFRTVEDVRDIEFSKIHTDKHSEKTEKFPHFEEEIFLPVRTPLIIDTPDLPGTYKLMTALVTKQLAAHDRQIGLLNAGGQFDALLRWVQVAAKEHFITKKCPKLMTVRKSARGLMNALEQKEHIVIDLHRDKWGD